MYVHVFSEYVCLCVSLIVSVSQVDPKQLLEDGIRKELVLQVAEALHSGLIFNP